MNKQIKIVFFLFFLTTTLLCCKTAKKKLVVFEEKETIEIKVNSACRNSTITPLKNETELKNNN